MRRDGEHLPRAWKLPLRYWRTLSDWGGGWEHFHIAQRLFTLQNILQRALFKILFKLHYEILWIKSSSLAWSGAEVNLIKSLSFTVEESNGVDD